MKVGQIIELSFGKVRIMKVHPCGTYDVECVKTGNWFRITGYRTQRLAS